MEDALFHTFFSAKKGKVGEGRKEGKKEGRQKEGKEKEGIRKYRRETQIE